MKLTDNWGRMASVGRHAFFEALMDQHQREVDSIQEDYDDLEDSYHALKRKHRNLIDQYNQLVLEFNDLVDIGIQLNTEHEQFKTAQAHKVEALQQQLQQMTEHRNSLIKEVEAAKEALTQSGCEKIRLENKMEKEFVRIQKKRMGEDLRKNLMLKVSFFQLRFFNKLVKELIEKGIVQQTFVDFMYSKAVKDEDDKDSKERNVTFNEAVRWLETNHPKIAQHLKILE